VAGTLTLSSTIEPVGWVSEAAVAGRVLVVPAAQSSGGGGGSGTFTQGTIATIEALTPASGDVASATDGPYQYQCFSAGTWQALHNGYSVTRPTFTEDAGMPTLRVEAVNTTVKREYAYASMADGESHVLGIIAPPFGGTAGSTDLYGIGLMESATGKFVLLQVSSDSPALRIRSHASIDGATVSTFFEWVSTGSGTVFPGDGRVYFRLSLGGGNTTWEMANSPLGPWFTMLQHSQTTYFTTAPDRVIFWYNNRNTAGSDVDLLPMSLACHTVT
jgi:hypothetical protein